MKLAYHRENEHRRRVARMFARITGRYDLMNTVMTLGMHHRWRREVAEQATLGLKGLALDVAAGTGDLSLALSSVSGVAEVIGLDFLTEMLQRARDKVRGRNVERVNFVVGDALHLPFPDDTFACAATAFGLRNMPDVRAALCEMVRVVRPGGMVVTLEIVPLDHKGMLSPLLRFYLRHVVPWLGVLVAGDREAYAYLPASVDRFPGPGRLAAMMEDAGLAGVSWKMVGMRMLAIHRGVKRT